MQIAFKVHKDAISPSLRKALRAAADPKPALSAAGEVLVQMAKRAFDEPKLRPAAWPALKPATLKAKARRGKSNAILKSNGTLWRSLRVLSADKTMVTVGSDRPYAAYHQLGTRHIPARPFFPVTAQGKLTETAKTRIESALKIKLGIKN